jgi:hypothetical protein
MTERRGRTPRDVDELPDGVCRHCGLVGSHANRYACIDALRSVLADREGVQAISDATEKAGLKVLQCRQEQRNDESSAT